MTDLIFWRREVPSFWDPQIHPRGEHWVSLWVLYCYNLAGGCLEQLGTWWGAVKEMWWPTRQWIVFIYHLNIGLDICASNFIGQAWDNYVMTQSPSLSVALSPTDPDTSSHSIITAHSDTQHPRTTANKDVAASLNSTGEIFSILKFLRALS